MRRVTIPATEAQQPRRRRTGKSCRWRSRLHFFHTSFNISLMDYLLMGYQ
jgi:hypothetical protein